MIFEHRFGFGKMVQLLKTDSEKLYRFWRQYTQDFPDPGGEPFSVYEALVNPTLFFKASWRHEIHPISEDDFAPILEYYFLEDITFFQPDRFHAYHAAAAADEDGAEIYLGASGSGKSTLSLDLVRRGKTYLSDDIVILNDDGDALAVPRPIQFKETEHPAELRPNNDDRFESFGYDLTAWVGYPDSAHFFRPLNPPAARAASAYPVKAFYYLDPTDGAPEVRRIEGAEVRARLALAELKVKAPEKASPRKE